MKKLVLFLFLLAAISLVCYERQMAAAPGYQNADSQQCSEGWKITGYFTPVEADYPRDGTQEITVRNGKLNFSSKFLRAVITEGWGKTDAGWYLGYDHETQKWQRSSEPLDDNGNRLQIGMIAADKGVLPSYSKVTISSLADSWGKRAYTVTDIGLTEFGEVSVKNKHIDVYTGEGKEAGQETFAISRVYPDELVEVCAAD